MFIEEDDWPLRILCRLLVLELNPLPGLTP